MWLIECQILDCVTKIETGETSKQADESSKNQK